MSKSYIAHIIWLGWRDEGDFDGLCTQLGSKGEVAHIEFWSGGFMGNVTGRPNKIMWKWNLGTFSPIENRRRMDVAWGSAHWQALTGCRIQNYSHLRVKYQMSWNSNTLLLSHCSKHISCFGGYHSWIIFRGPVFEIWLGKGYLCSSVLWFLLRKILRKYLQIPWPYFHYSLTHSLTYGAESFLRRCQLCSHSRTSRHFVELERALPCSREPSTGPCPEPDQSIPYHPILSLWRSILIWSTYLRLSLHSGLFPSGLPTNILNAFLFIPFVLYALPISYSLSWSF
jgi:hypothetical protein